MISPLRLLVLMWAGIHLMYFLVPISYRYPADYGSFLVAWLMITVFSLTYIPSKWYQLGTTRVQTLSRQWLRLCIVLGVSGALFSISSKIIAQGGVSLLEFADLRSQRAQSLMAGESVSSDLLGMFGFVFYPAGIVTVIYGVLEPKSVTRREGMMLIIYIVAMVAMGIISGGRSALFVLLVLMVISFYLADRTDHENVHRLRYVKHGILSAIVLFSVYSTVVWSTRIQLAESSAHQFVKHAERGWGVTMDERVRSYVYDKDMLGIVPPVLGTTFYFTQNVSVTQRVLDSRNDEVLFGGYHIDVVAALFRMNEQMRMRLANGYAQLARNDIYGYFTGAWAALLIDYGIFGSLIYLSIWGIITGRLWRSYRSDPHITVNKIYLVYAYYAILISFVSPPLGFANSGMIILWAVISRLLGSKRIVI